MKILSNKAKCLLCGDVITSTNEKDYVYCQCKALAVSGGQVAILRLGHHNHFVELSEKDYS
ncbi:hypothetical protein EZV73_12095 [Acidaminobacter sp. JC074]|uniref:DUF7695 domain-containing protein n=1 Tax=Acidaminobacter sp. JC074 TaxID=2530199 RepID=UPI001F0DAB9E|nr:hypothetical protein [Acidaminobacter sp. JC074]MCH4888322.1 hypothetical protein [Acidaminobacter sp. JC074]